MAKQLKRSPNTSCKEAIRDFIMTKEAPDGSKVKDVVTDPKTKARYQAHGHLTDLTDYFFVSAFRKDFDNYQNGGRTWITPKWGKNPPSKNNY